jgi:hypothetical protein
MKSGPDMGHAQSSGAEDRMARAMQRKRSFGDLTIMFSQLITMAINRSFLRIVIPGLSCDDERQLKMLKNGLIEN